MTSRKLRRAGGEELGQSSVCMIPRVSLPTESEIVGTPGGTVELDEHEHQALDLLDEQPRGASQDAVPGEVRAAEDVVRVLLARLASVVSITLIDAASQLARTEDRGSLEIVVLDEIRLTLVENPRLSLAIAPTVETLGTILGLDRDAAAWALLLELAEQAHTEADERLHNCSTAIAERLAATEPNHASAAGETVTRALRVFRSAAVIQAGPSIRAQLLAADHPEHLGLARALVEHHVDAATLVDAFDHARTAFETAAAERPARPPSDGAPPQIDGPKRKFTRVHVILALIVLGLTLWHYVFR